MNLLLDYLQHNMRLASDSTILVVSKEKSLIKFSELLDQSKKMASNFVSHKYGILEDDIISVLKILFACLYSNSTVVILPHQYGDNLCNKIIQKTKLSYIVNSDGISQISPDYLETEDLSDVAYIMCTSGTTGQPKAAMVTYRNILSNIKDICVYFNISCHDTILITRPLCHASALVGEFFVSLVSGANIVFYSDYNPFFISKILSEKNITVFCSTPTVCVQLAEICARKKQSISLKKLVLSGECLTRSVANRLIEAFPNVEIYNVYGLTEASPRVSYLPPESFRGKPESVGIPLNTVKVKIIDDELYVKGNNVMKGYYEDPELTKRTIKNGWLKTGDFAIKDSQGFLYIKGRKDDLIIRAGINVYPQEIENALLQDRRIENVVAYRIKGNPYGDRIGLKVVAKKLTEEKIFSICKQLLPNYQIPDLIECVDNIPKNESGKALRTQ